VEERSFSVVTFFGKREVARMSSLTNASPGSRAPEIIWRSEDAIG
jgi:hypothetical protein